MCPKVEKPDASLDYGPPTPDDIRVKAEVRRVTNNVTPRGVQYDQILYYQFARQATTIGAFRALLAQDLKVGGGGGSLCCNVICLRKLEIRNCLGGGATAKGGVVVVMMMVMVMRRIIGITPDHHHHHHHWWWWWLMFRWMPIMLESMVPIGLSYMLISMIGSTSWRSKGHHRPMKW